MNDAANETNAIALEGDEPQRPAGLGRGRIGLDEPLITLTEATKHLPLIDGHKVAVCTLWRWCRRGLRGVCLEYVRVGRKICTTRQALLRFFTALADLDERVDPNRYAKPTFLPRTHMTSRRRQQALAQADAVLERAGI